MTIEKKFINKNIELQKRVLTEIENVKLGLSNKNILQLNSILKELNASEKSFDITLSYPRIIVDSWDYSDQLGLQLIELSELYKKIKRRKS